MREKEKTRVIWRHPQGRFEIQETEHYSLFDHCTYYTRECVFTPQDDARGLCSEVPTGIFVPEEIKQDGRRQPRVTDEEKQRLAKMYQAGMLFALFQGRPDGRMRRSQTCWRSWAAGKRFRTNRFTGRTRNFKRRSPCASAAICSRRSARRSARAIMPCRISLRGRGTDAFYGQAVRSFS